MKKSLKNSTRNEENSISPSHRRFVRKTNDIYLDGQAQTYGVRLILGICSVAFLVPLLLLLQSRATFISRTNSVNVHPSWLQETRFEQPGPIGNLTTPQSVGKQHRGGVQREESVHLNLQEWKEAVIQVRIDEDRLNNEAHAKKKEEKGEEPMEGDLKVGWVAEVQERRRKYPPYLEGLDLSKKYMFYNLTNDYAAGVLHYGRSLSGMLRESHRLGRVAVWLPILVPSHHNRGKNEVKDPALIFDKQKAKEVFEVELIDEAEFFGRYKRSVINGDVVTWGMAGIAEHQGTKELLNHKDQVLQRSYQGVWNKFVFALRSDPELKDMNSELTYAPHLVALREAVLGELGEDFDCVHVRRGDKMRRKHQWPHLENDTSPESLLEKLPKLVNPGRLLYISSDEFQEGFFDPLRKIYNVKMAEDFKHFWAPGSDWYKSSVEIAGEIPEPTFDNFQQGFVDYGVCEKAKVRIETFPHLATDPWNGLRRRFFYRL